MQTGKDKFDISVTFEGAPDTTRMNKLSEEDVDRLLTSIPPTKLAQGRKVLIAMDERDRATENTKRIVASYRMIAAEEKEARGLGSDKDREAWVLSQSEVQAAKEAEIEAVLEVKLQEYIYQYLEDMFISARKQANKYEKALETDMQVAKYMRH